MCPERLAVSSHSAWFTFFPGKLQWKNPAVNSLARRPQKWLCTSLPGCVHVREQEPWMRFSCTWPDPHHTRSYVFLILFLSTSGSSPGHRSASTTCPSGPHHCSLHPRNDRGRSRCVPSQASPSSSLKKSHSPNAAFLAPSPQSHFLI